jgi:hypothetical protein
VYRELQPHIQYLKAALAGYLSLSERIRRLEDLENYEPTVSLKLLAVWNTLHAADLRSLCGGASATFSAECTFYAAWQPALPSVVSFCGSCILFLLHRAITTVQCIGNSF